VRGGQAGDREFSKQPSELEFLGRNRRQEKIHLDVAGHILLNGHKSFVAQKI